MHSPARSVLGLALGLAHLGAVAFSQEGEAQDPAGDDSARIIGPVADGTPPAPRPPGELPEFTIRSTTVVSKGGRRIVLHRVDDPNLPEPPPPPPPPTEEELEALRQSPEVLKAREDMERTVHCVVSATVYDHRITRIRWWPEMGRPESFEGWSNFDWNHLSGFCGFEARGNLFFTLLMGIGNTTSEDLEEMRGKGFDVTMPELPRLPSLEERGPVYAVTRGDVNDEKAMLIMDALHDLYAAEGGRLAAAHEGREQARREREAFLKANPPRPRDTVIHYWRRPRQAPAGPEGGER